MRLRQLSAAPTTVPSRELTHFLCVCVIPQLLEREPTKRMGMATCKMGDIYDQPWFRGVDWPAIEKMRVKPPFVPEVVSWLAAHD